MGKDAIITDTSKSLSEEFGDQLSQIPQETLQAIAIMNRRERRAWIRSLRKRGRGYTR